jgi:hypothetical protein
MSLKLISFYFIAFVILYLEPIQISGITFGVLWKIVLIFVFSLPVIYGALKSKQMELFAFLYIIFAFKTLFSYSSMDYFMNTMTFTLKVLMFPILYLSLLKISKESLFFIAKHFAILIVLSFIPYILGILEPLGEGYDLAPYGLDGQFGLVGPFLNPHSASISLAFAMIVISLLVNSKNRLSTNLFYLFLIALAFYELIGTYVRTGLAVYFVALGYMFLQNLNFKKILFIIVSMSILGGVGVYIVSTSKVAQMRLEDRNKYVKNDEVGSGRLTYWKSAVKNWSNDENIVLFIGLGEMYAEEKMEKAVGLKIFAHNEFFQMLQQEGLIGFFLFLSSLITLYRYIKRYQDSSYYQYSMAIFIGMIAMMMFQGGFYFNMIFFLSIFLVLEKQDILTKNGGI